MVYRFVWADGQLELSSGYSKRDHHYILLEQAMIALGHYPENYVGGMFNEDDFHGPEFDTIQIIWAQGEFPSNDQLKYLIQLKLNRFKDREAMIQERVDELRLAATSEDTEPEYNFSFLKNPHKMLYPPAFNGTDHMSPKVVSKIKSHVLNPLADAGYNNADQFIYFTVYGSGISYNWDEDGDFDVQMWVDASKYNESHDEPVTSDDLVADIRRIVQPINFPSFEDIGLTADGSDKVDGATGAMLIQYYPKPGTGSKDENLASKPYSCYDLETGDWLQRPREMTPEFYGEHFLSVSQKAEDIAMQAEALLEELNRNTVSWQFWMQLNKELPNEQYAKAADDARENAEQEKAGVVNLFEGVFGGRAKAYSEEGEGIDDERDIVQKLLEVWGVFQRLKHFARQPLPWEEQEMPKDARVVLAESIMCSFAWIDGHLYCDGSAYHYELADNHPEVLEASENPSIPQVWGQVWTDNDGNLSLDITSDWLWSNNEYEEYEDERRDHSEVADQIKGQRTWREQAAQALADYFARPITLADANIHGGWYTIHPRTSSIEKFADWNEVMQNAVEIRDNGAVNITSNQPDHVEGTVASQERPGVVYDTEFDRADPNSGSITTWRCTCPWGQVSWGRTRQWQKYEGRPCKHVLAMYWVSLSQPTDDQQQLFSPLQYQPAYQPAMVPGGPNVGPSGLPSPVTQPAAPAPQPPQPSIITQPGQGGTVSIPGTFSKVAVFQNGQVIRATKDMYGLTRDDQTMPVPAGSIGEVLWSDERETIAIFPLDSGILEPHLVRVQDNTANFAAAKARTPFVRRR